MNARELIEALSKLPPETPVVIEDTHYLHWDIAETYSRPRWQVLPAKLPGSGKAFVLSSQSVRLPVMKVSR